MKIKSFIQLFVPPLFFSIKSKIKYGTPVFIDRYPKEEMVYNSICEINERHGLKLTDLENLSMMPRFHGSCQVVLGVKDESGYYGVFHILQKYAQVPFRNFPPKDLRVQHGMICEMLNWEKAKLENINWVWSPFVKSMYSEYTQNPHIYPIGAPFFYAESILSEEEIKQEKKRLGKNLLVFPSHSTAFANCSYDNQTFINKLNTYKSQFDSIRICVYWADYVRGYAKPYLDAGFECVTCGHIADPFFLERQKALFAVADASISNSVGSHIGFSIYMHKPHVLLEDDAKWENILEGCTVTKEGMELRHHSNNYREIRDAFINKTDFVITEEQKRVVDKYWGVSCIKSPAELRKMIEEAYRLSE